VACLLLIRLIYTRELKSSKKRRNDMNEELYDIVNELSTRIGRLGERVKALEEKSKRDDERIATLEKKDGV